MACSDVYARHHALRNVDGQSAFSGPQSICHHERSAPQQSPSRPAKSIPAFRRSCRRLFIAPSSAIPRIAIPRPLNSPTISSIKIRLGWKSALSCTTGKRYARPGSGKFFFYIMLALIPVVHLRLASVFPCEALNPLSFPASSPGLFLTDSSKPRSLTSLRFSAPPEGLNSKIKTNGPPGLLPQPGGPCLGISLLCRQMTTDRWPGLPASA